jgi:outer membrane immunogenic protein
MKKALLALVAATAFTGSAFAADMAVKAPPMAPPPPPPPTFTGCWLSGGVGYGLFDQENTSFDTFDFFGTGGAQLTDTSTTGGKGWLGRVGGGCDYQFSFLGNQSWVIGGFADYDWTNIRGRVEDPLLGGTFGGGFGAVGEEKMNNQWAVGGRIGWVPLPGLLTFVSGGYTQAHFDATSFNASVFPFIGTPLLVGRDAATYHGWFVGGGEEYAFTWLPVPGLFWKTEYRVSEFDRQNLIVRDLTDGDLVATTQSKKWVQTVTTSLVWRFNWGNWGAPTRY